MPAVAAAFSDALAVEGLWLVALVVLVAGLMRGFAGFGSAMIYMPFAAAAVPAVWALQAMLVFDTAGTLPLLRRAGRDADRGDLVRMSIGALICAPFGLFLLARIDPAPFSWLLSVIILVLLAALASGWRYRGRLRRRWVVGVGGLGGFLSGLTGLAGPPVIMFYMSRPLAPAMIRANILIYLFLADLLTLIVMLIGGLIEAVPLALGVLLWPIYMGGGMIGARLFNPAHERLYRMTAYVLIFAAAVVNLPILR
jgi:uncharacterized membrane protein YfcA